VIGGLASVLDLVPTILAATGTPAPNAGLAREGVSLLPALRDAKAPIRGPDDELADEMYNHRYVIKGPYKVERTDPLFYGWSFFLNHDWQLYDLAADRGETSALLQRGLDDKSGATPDANAKVMDDLIQDWDAYARRTGAVVPGR
jgi:arylsulfatase